MKRILKLYYVQFESKKCCYNESKIISTLLNIFKIKNKIDIYFS